jgi:transposase
MPLLPKISCCSNSDCPHEGKFGNNIISLATLFRYGDRLPHRKIHDALKRLYGLKISPATIFDLVRRAADAVRSEYDAILNKIRDVPILYVDETSIHVQGEKHWIWTFTTQSETFFVIRKGSRRMPDKHPSSRRGILRPWRCCCSPVTPSSLSPLYP